MKAGAEAQRRGIALAMSIAFAVAACATEELPTFGDLGCVAGGCHDVGGGSATSSSSSNTTSTSSGGMCVDAPCAVSFKDDIFGPILDGTAGCTSASGCHGGVGAPGNMTLNPGDAAGTYLELTNYQLDNTPGPAGPYVVPCDPQASRLLCNLVLDAGDGSAKESPYGSCGVTMPIALGTAKRLTEAEFDTIVEWIECGAPDN
jgi:hypothetical protein